jgi:phosphoglycolate phosphatase-like HAD superfamily hydrolase
MNQAPVGRSADHMVLFDIDGTLLELQPWENAVYLRAFADCYGITGQSDDWDGYRSRTDVGVAREILERHFGRPCAELELQTVLGSYSLLLRKEIDEGGFLPQIIPGARRMLETLSGQEGITLALVTGNLAATARMRLESVGLWSFFHTGAFAEDGEHKGALLGRVIERCRALGPTSAATGAIVYVGDQVTDAHAAREHEVHFVGIGYRPHRRARLRGAGVECIFEDYRNLAAFLQHLRGLWA